MLYDESCLMSGLPPRISRMVKGTGVSPQGFPRLVGKLVWFRSRRWVRALHGEETWLRAWRSEEVLRGAECDRWWLWSCWILVLGSRWWTVRLSLGEIVCWFHIETIAGSGSGPCNWCSKGCRWRCCRACTGGNFVLCKTARLWTVNIPFSLPVTGKTEWMWPVHIESHCDVWVRRWVRVGRIDESKEETSWFCSVFEWGVGCNLCCNVASVRNCVTQIGGAWWK